MKKYAALLLAVAMMIFAAPALEVKAAAPAAPKDAAQTVSVENGFRVQWSPVAGATQYYYSFSADDKTYTAESLTGNGGKENFVNIVNTSVLQPGTFYYVRVRSSNGAEFSQYVKIKVATAPKAPTRITQTAADSKSVTLSWDASTGASGYMIRFGTSQGDSKDIQRITTTSCKLTGLNPDSKYYVAIYPIKQVSAKFYASQNYVENPKVVTTGGPVAGLKLYDWDVKSNVIMFQWSNALKYESGYQLQIYDASNTKKLKTYTIPGRRTTMKAVSLKTVKNKPFLFRIRSYTTLAGKKSYGEWSSYRTAVPQANVKATKLSDTSVRLSWDKVEGAKSYTIYRATKDGGKFKKIKTTTKTAYRVKNLKTYKDYYFYVQANKTKLNIFEDGKLIKTYTRSSSKLPTPNDINVYIFKYQDTVCED